MQHPKVPFALVRHTPVPYALVSYTLIGLAVILVASPGCRPTPEAKPHPSVDAPTPPEASRPPTPAAFEREMMSIADVSEKAVPSVVNISTQKKLQAQPDVFSSPFFSDPLFRRFFDRAPESRQRPPERLERSLGSGVIVNANGVILTNHHVVANADEVLVTLHDKREFTAEIVGKDPPSDLAVLKLKAPPPDLRGLPVGDSDALRLGEIVVAIGNPFGVGQTVTMGIVSAKGRANVGIVDYEDFIQTDAAINPGNSGGALLNLRGELVGINTAILSQSGGYQGIGFAIPSNMASSIMGSLIQEGRVIRGFLGVIIQDLTPDLADAMGLPDRNGALVSEVLAASPAEKAGVRAGDVIRKVDGRPITTSAKLRNVVASIGAGRTVKLHLLRNGRDTSLNVELTAKESDDHVPPKTRDGRAPLGGVSLERLTEPLRREFRISRRIPAGVVVTNVKRGSPAERSGLQVGDVVVSVNRRPVQTPEEFGQLYAEGQETVLLRLFRRGGPLYLVMRK